MQAAPSPSRPVVRHNYGNLYNPSPHCIYDTLRPLVRNSACALSLVVACFTLSNGWSLNTS